jgi:hypothetical protein
VGGTRCSVAETLHDMVKAVDNVHPFSGPRNRASQQCIEVRDVEFSREFDDDDMLVLAI